MSRVELAPRELEVLRLLADGLANKEIAARLFISEKTAKNHVSNILETLEVVNRTQAVAYYVRHIELHAGCPCVVQQRGGRHCQEAVNA